MFLFAYFPYFPSDRADIKVNRLHLFNFWQFKDQYIPNPQIRERMRQFCELYVDTSQNVLQTMTIAVIDENYEFAVLTDDQMDDIRKYASGILLTSLGKNSDDCGNFHSCCVSEHFLYFFQEFDLALSYMTYTSGSYVRTKNMASDINKTRFVRPDYVSGTLMHFYDKRLYQAFANAVDAHDATLEYLYTVLDWVKYAFLNSEGYSYESRVVMMATGFEVFFHIPRNDKSKVFAERLEALLGVDGYDIYDEHYNTIQTGLTRTTKMDGAGKVKCYRGNVPINLTVYGWWAREFYDLRSKIVHNGVVQHSDLVNHKDAQYLKVSLRMMLFCFFKLLADKGYVVLHKEADWNSIAIHLEEKDHREIEKSL